jgi:AraC-like DNA-binding protein
MDVQYNQRIYQRISEVLNEKEIIPELRRIGIACQLFSDIIEHYGTLEERYAPRQDSEIVTEIVQYIYDHYQENITLESLAAEFFVSKYHLSHEFSHRVGTSVYRYVIFRRLLQARELITSGQAPGEVYQSCGFGDYANFYRAFKGEYGISPREFAQQVQ